MTSHFFLFGSCEHSFNVTLWYRYIAKTLYSDDDEEDDPENSKTVEEPKVLGLNPGSDEKVRT